MNGNELPSINLLPEAGRETERNHVLLAVPAPLANPPTFVLLRVMTFLDIPPG